MPDRIAFRMNLFPGQAAEYEKRHDEIFPDLVVALKEVGISDYTIWLDPEDHHLFAILTRSDNHTLAQLPDQGSDAALVEAHGRHPWRQVSDHSPIQIPLQRVFYLP